MIHWTSATLFLTGKSMSLCDSSHDPQRGRSEASVALVGVKALSLCLASSFPMHKR